MSRDDPQRVSRTVAEGAGSRAPGDDAPSRPVFDPFAPGTILAGKYEVERVLGKGGMGIVVAAHHLKLKDRVAIKMLRPEALDSPELVARFAREARAAVRIKSEHVARITDVGELEDGAPYMVMEYLDGVDLATVIRERAPLPIEETVDYVMQACVALAEAHAIGIVHRDVKPENLFLCKGGGWSVVKVLDFGISKAALTGSALDDGMQLTQTLTLMGSPLYMSPEQIRRGKIDPRTDIWSLGVVLYEMLTGRPPFPAESITELCARVLEEPTPALKRLRPDAPVGLEHALSRCLAKSPNERFDNVAELVLALLPFGPRRARMSAERITSMISASGVTRVALTIPGSIPPPRDDDSLRPQSRTQNVSQAIMLSPSGSLPAAQGGVSAMKVFLLAGAAAVIAGGVAFALRPAPPPMVAPPTSAAAPVAPPALEVSSPAPLPANPPAASASASTFQPLVPAPSASPDAGSPGSKRQAPGAKPTPRATGKPGDPDLGFLRGRVTVFTPSTHRDALIVIMTWSRERARAGVLCIGCFVLGSSAAAQDPAAGDIGAARELGKEGVNLADAGKCVDAIDKLRAAAAIVPVATLLGRLGECQVETGLLVEGTETLQRVVREKLPANAPEAFAIAHARAQKVLEGALPRVPRLRVSVAPETAKPSVSIDGVAIAATLVGAARPTNPGQRTVSVTAPEYEPATRLVTLKEGVTETITITLVPAPVAALAPSAAPSPPAMTSAPPIAPSPPSRPRPEPPSRVPAYVAFGAGGASVVLGAVFGFVAIGKKGDLDKTCAAKACPPGSGASIDSMSTMATLSTVGFALGAVGAGLGTYFLISSGESERATLGLGPSSVTLSTRF